MELTSNVVSKLPPRRSSPDGNHSEPTHKGVTPILVEVKPGTPEDAVVTPSKSVALSFAPVNKSGRFDQELVALGEPTGEELPVLLKVH